MLSYCSICWPLSISLTLYSGGLKVSIPSYALVSSSGDFFVMPAHSSLLLELATTSAMMASIFAASTLLEVVAGAAFGDASRGPRDGLGWRDPRRTRISFYCLT